MHSNEPIFTLLQQWKSTNQLTAAVVSIQDQKNHITDYYNGYTTLEKSTPLSINNLFGVGSITKTFTAAAILLLQETNKLRLDDALGTYISEYPRWHSITLRQLLNMTSGLTNYTDLPIFYELSEHSREHCPAQKMIDLAYQASDLSPPGQTWQYCNTNYLLLGLILEQVAKEPVGDFFKKHFFEPLGLKNTYFSDSFYPESVLYQMAHGYFRNKDYTNFNASFSGAAGSMVMNSHDILTWARALLAPGKVLQPSSLKEMQTTIPTQPTPPWPEAAEFGLGILSYDIPKLGRTWYYTGVIQGYTSIFLHIPIQNITIAAQAASWPDPEETLLFPDQFFMSKLLNKLFGCY